jgi:dTDP-4-amino-4,6-dideoxygalactose transaminase
MPELALNGGTPVRRRPFPAWPEVDEQDEGAVLETVRSGRWWMYAYSSAELAGEDQQGGSRVEAFERAFARFQHARYAIATSSGSGALEIACRAIGLKPGDEVISTPYSFIASISCVLNSFAIPVFVDIDPATYNIDPGLVEAAITERTRAILPVHFGGNVADMTRLSEIARRHNLALIEDSAQAAGASLQGGRWAGTLGDIGIFSLQQSKVLTCGEGGIITTNDPELACLAWSLRHNGRTESGLWYEHVRLGWHYRMTELQGTLALSQLRKLQSQNERRTKNAFALFDALKGLPGIEACERNPETDQHAFYLAIFRYDGRQWDNLPRDTVIAALQAEGIPCLSGYTFPLYENPLFCNIEFNCPSLLYRTDRGGKIDFSRYRGTCPVAERACRDEAIWLTQNLLLGTAEDTLDIASAFLKVYENRGELSGAAQCGLATRSET